MSWLDDAKVSRRSFTLGGIALSGLTGSGWLAQPALAADKTFKANLALFSPGNKHALAFASEQKALGVNVEPAEGDISEILMSRILPNLNGSDFNIIGSTRGYIAFSLQEVLRDRGYEIVASSFADSRCNSQANTLPSAVELNCDALVNWRLERTGIAFVV